MPPAAVACTVEPASLHAHLLRVSLHIQRPAAQQTLSLPVWIPGSYLVREFSRNLQNLRASQRGRPLAVAQTAKNTWQLRCNPEHALLIEYEVYAFDRSVRAAWMDANRCFFNSASVCLRVHGQEDAPHLLALPAAAWPGSWQLATALPAQKVNRRGFGNYRAESYDELADSPVEMGRFWSGAFTACGVPHRLVVSGAPATFDGQRLLRDAQTICTEAIRLWHPRGKPPHSHYLFLLNAVDNDYGGLEHRNATALICRRRSLPRIGQMQAGDDYVTLLGLISHEYFHAWCVKRLRPAEFTRYDYDRENYTRLLWFFEGFTSYYDDLLLRRSGLIDNAAWLDLLARGMNQTAQTPGRHIQSAAQASFDAWIRYYRPDENTVNATVSYYARGAQIAACLDLKLRSQGKATLDDVMRALWQHCQAGPMREDDLLDVLRQLTGRSWAREIRQWVHSTAELPLPALLQKHGVRVTHKTAPLADALGLRCDESATGILVRSVLRGGVAEQAGMATADEWLGIADVQGHEWRLMRLDELPLHAAPGQPLTAIVARDRRLLRLPLTMPAPAAARIALAVADEKRINAWLGKPPAT